MTRRDSLSRLVADPPLAECLLRIEAGSDRLYDLSFLGRSWLAGYVADVDTLCMAVEDSNQREEPK